MRANNANKCSGCGQCCTFSNGFPFITPHDVNIWLEHDLWFIINQMTLAIKSDDNTQQWTFGMREDKTCVFRLNGKCSIYRKPASLVRQSQAMTGS